MTKFPWMILCLAFWTLSLLQNPMIGISQVNANNGSNGSDPTDAPAAVGEDTTPAPVTIGAAENDDEEVKALKDAINKIITKGCGGCAAPEIAGELKDNCEAAKTWRDCAVEAGCEGTGELNTTLEKCGGDAGGGEGSSGNNNHAPIAVLFACVLTVFMTNII